MCRGDVSSQRARVGGSKIAVQIAMAAVIPAVTAGLVPRTMRASAVAKDVANVANGVR
jgi:hypothetical protein